MQENKKNQGSFNNGGLRTKSPMEVARQNMQNGSNSNPYYNNSTDQISNQNPYYRDSSRDQSSYNSTQQPNSSNATSSVFDSFDTSNFIKGALIGAIGAYLVTNENAQKAIFKTVAKGTQTFQAGMEEMKERFEDAKAELDAEQQS